MSDIKENQLTVNEGITLTPEQSEEFQTAIIIGMYKELHRKGLLTDAQLKKLIEMQKK